MALLISTHQHMLIKLLKDFWLRAFKLRWPKWVSGYFIGRPLYVCYIVCMLVFIWKFVYSSLGEKLIFFLIFPLNLTNSNFHLFSATFNNSFFCIFLLFLTNLIFIKVFLFSETFSFFFWVWSPYEEFRKLLKKSQISLLKRKL